MMLIQRSHFLFPLLLRVKTNKKITAVAAAVTQKRLVFV